MGKQQSKFDKFLSTTKVILNVGKDFLEVKQLYMDCKYMESQQSEITSILSQNKLEDLLEKYSSLANRFKESYAKAKITAMTAEQYAKDAKEHGVSFFSGKADAIQALQEAIPHIAQAQLATVEVQHITFFYIQLLSEVVRRIQSLTMQNKFRISEVISALEQYTESDSFKEHGMPVQSPMKNLYEDLQYHYDLQKQIEELRMLISNPDQQQIGSKHISIAPR